MTRAGKALPDAFGIVITSTEIDGFKEILNSSSAPAPETLENAINSQNILLLEYLLLPKNKWAALDAYLHKHELELEELNAETRDKLFFEYAKKNSLIDLTGNLGEKILSNTQKIPIYEQTIQTAATEDNKIYNKRLFALHIMEKAIEDQRYRDQGKYIGKSVGSVSGIIVGAAIGSLFFPPIGTGIGALIGGALAWYGVGKLTGAGTNKASPEKLAIAPGVDWGAILGLAIGSAVGSVVPVIGTAIGAAVGAAIGSVIGGYVSHKMAKHIAHPTSKVATNIAAALGGIVCGFIGAAIGSVVPGLGTAIGAAAGACLGAALFGGGTFLKLRTEKIPNQELDASRKMAAAGGIVGATTGAGIGALIGTFIFPGIGTAVGAAIGSVVGMLGVGGIAYKRAEKKESRLSTVMGVTGAISGAKIGAVIGAGIGLLLTPFLGPVGIPIGTAVGAALGAIAGGIRARSGRFAKKPETNQEMEKQSQPEKSESRSKSPSEPKNFLDHTATHNEMIGIKKRTTSDQLPQASSQTPSQSPLRDENSSPSSHP